MAIIKSQRPKPSLSSELKIFVFLECSNKKGNFFSNSCLYKVKKKNLHKSLCRLFCLFIETGLRFSGVLDFPVQSAFLAVQYGFGQTVN